MSDALSTLQRSVLEKYRTLADCLHELNDTLVELNTESDTNPEQVLAQMREIEVKIALVGTLLKGSVYSLVLQRNMGKQAPGGKG
ncbi:AaceriAFL021Cp [[Ashbya] aceris (nom. inval.)]|nr:AaceriAFL021Cp [[Ashbya] aceris (nom. inval.)]